MYTRLQRYGRGALQREPKDVLGKNCAYVGAKYSSQYLHLNKMCETTRNLLEILDQPVFESLL